MRPKAAIRRIHIEISYDDDDSVSTQSAPKSNDTFEANFIEGTCIDDFFNCQVLNVHCSSIFNFFILVFFLSVLSSHLHTHTMFSYLAKSDFVILLYVSVLIVFGLVTENISYENKCVYDFLSSCTWVSLIYARSWYFICLMTNQTIRRAAHIALSMSTMNRVYIHLTIV